jgi:exosome complex component MTR3
VYGPRPLPRNAAFSPNLQLTASVKFAPFATRVRRGYIRDSTERDLGIHLENALKGMIIQDRWPKSAIDVAVIVLESEDDSVLRVSEHQVGVRNVGLMNILAGCITVASAALLDARIDCLDLMTGGVAASVRTLEGPVSQVLDPSPTEHDEIQSGCVVAYLASRDEVTEVWTTGNLLAKAREEDAAFEGLLDHAVSAARAVQPVLKEVVVESAMRIADAVLMKGKSGDQPNDIEMKQ